MGVSPCSPLSLIALLYSFALRPPLLCLAARSGHGWRLCGAPLLPSKLALGRRSSVPPPFDVTDPSLSEPTHFTSAALAIVLSTVAVKKLQEGRLQWTLKFRK